MRWEERDDSERLDDLDDSRWRAREEFVSIAENLEGTEILNGENGTIGDTGHFEIEHEQNCRSDSVPGKLSRTMDLPAPHLYLAEAMPAAVFPAILSATAATFAKCAP